MNDRTARDDTVFRPDLIGPRVGSGSQPCARGTLAENYAHDMEAVDLGEDGPTVLYCRRGCGTTLKLEVPQ